LRIDDHELARPRGAGFAPWLGSSAPELEANAPNKGGAITTAAWNSPRRDNPRDSPRDFPAGSDGVVLLWFFIGFPPDAIDLRRQPSWRCR
jgi:hypothetical protein